MSLMMMAWSFNGLIGLPIGVLADAAGERAVLVGMGVSVCAIFALLSLWRMRLPTAPRAVEARYIEVP
jgi:hypothetical protein